MLNSMLRKKSISTQKQPSELHKSLDVIDLTLMGIGAIIGAGVFVLTGIAAATYAGPAIIVSYSIAAIASMFAALSYAELAASVGGSGSAYSYAYTGFGEFVAWLIGWNLLLEYIVAVAAVAIGWSGYIDNLLQSINIFIPEQLTKNPFEGGIIDLPAMLIIIALTFLLCVGVKQSARFNAIMVIIKLITIALFIIIAALNVDPVNWTNFAPFGWSGIMGGAAIVFFAYIGFDALSTATEEAINPQRDIPIAILLSLIICSLIYIAVSGLLTGIVPYTALNVDSPVSDALLHLGHRVAAGFIAAGAIAGLTTVMLVMFYGITRICLAIASDGLISSKLAVINPKTHTPVRCIVILGIIITAIAGFVPIGRAAELVNIGTLAAFTFVCGGVLMFRKTHPNIPRPFKLPFSPLIPLLGMIFCIYLMASLPAVTWWRFLIWTLAGICIYFFYGIRHSHLRSRQS